MVGEDHIAGGDRIAGGGRNRICRWWGKTALQVVGKDRITCEGRPHRRWWRKTVSQVVGEERITGGGPHHRWWKAGDRIAGNFFQLSSSCLYNSI